MTRAAEIRYGPVPICLRFPADDISQAKSSAWECCNQSLSRGNGKQFISSNLEQVQENKLSKRSVMLMTGSLLMFGTTTKAQSEADKLKKEEEKSKARCFCSDVSNPRHRR